MKNQTLSDFDFDSLDNARPPRHVPDCSSIRSNMTLWVKFGMCVLVAMVLGCEKNKPVPDSSDSPPPRVTHSEERTGTKSSTHASETPSSPEQEADPSPKELVGNYKETIPPTLVEFEMVLVPVSEKNEKPFYIGKTEVTWDEFAFWALCKDIKEKKAIIEREKKLRPSAPHDSERIYRGWGQENQPVVGISRLSAELYCAWLSKQTGKKYRLPTPEEWDAAFVAGGGVLDETIDKAKLKDIAWYEGNTFDEDTFDNRAMPVGKKTPNKIGVHDMLGNVAEWVSGDEQIKVARGGSFVTKAEDLKGAMAQEEDQAVWNKNYPQDPKSIWWYVDADYVGFRVVCEP